MAAAGVAATEHVLRSTLRADQIITYDAAKAMSPAAQAVSTRFFVCKPCSSHFDKFIRVRDAFYGRGGKAARLYSRCDKQGQVTTAANEGRDASKREETAAANERGTPLLDLVRTHDEQERIVAAICRSDVIRGLPPHATIHIFATATPLFGDNWATVYGKGLQEALNACARSDATVRVDRGGKYAAIGKAEMERYCTLELLAMGEHVDQWTGPAKDFCIEGLLVKGFVDAGTQLAAAGGGRIVNNSFDARGCKILDGDGNPIRGRLATVWMLVVANGWERAGTKKEQWVLMDGDDVHATRSSVGAARSILRKPSGERDDLVAVGAGAGAGAGVLSAAAAISVRESGDCWRVGSETSEEMYLRAQGIRALYGPFARDRDLPPLPAPYAGLRVLAVQGLIVIVQENITLWRAMSLPEAKVMRAAEAAGAETPLQFARPLGGEVRSADEWAAVLVRHVERGSHELSSCVSWTAGSSTIAARLAETAIEGGTPSRRVVCIDSEDVRDGVLVRIGGSRLLERDAPTRTAAFANQLCEVLLLTERGIDTHTVSVEKDVVVGYMGVKSATEGTWDGVFKGAVLCFTGMGASPDATQLKMVKALGGRVSSTPAKSMTLLISTFSGVAGHKKTKLAKELSVPSMAVQDFGELLIKAYDALLESRKAGKGKGKVATPKATPKTAPKRRASSGLSTLAATPAVEVGEVDAAAATAAAIDIVAEASRSPRLDEEKEVGFGGGKSKRRKQ